MPLDATPGSATADSFNTLEELSAYHIAHNNARWLDAEVYQQEAAARRATLWLEGAYRFRGSIAGTAQALGWPRVGVYDTDGRPVGTTVIPLAIKRAHAEAALYALDNDLLPVQRGAAVKRRKVGPIETEYFGAGSTGRVALPWVDALLAPLVVGPGLGAGGGGMVILERA